MNIIIDDKSSANNSNNNNINNNFNNQNINTRVESRVLFDYRSGQLWPEEDPDVDMDYEPPPNARPQSMANLTASPAIIDDHYQNVPSVDTNSPLLASDLSDQLSPRDQPSSDDNNRTVPSIKISKNKRKNSKNWSIVGQQQQSAAAAAKNGTKKSNGLNVETNGQEVLATPAPTGPKKRGRKPGVKINNGFTVMDATVTAGQTPTKRQKKCDLSERKRTEKDYCKQKSAADADDGGGGGGRQNDGRKVNKMHTKWQFNCLLNKVDIDFEQRLPNEILIKIFDYVLVDDKNRTQTIINLSQVCESWRKLLIKTPFIWNSLDLQSISDVNFHFDDLFSLLSDNELFVCMKSLNLSGWSGSNAERVLDIIATNCRENLHQLSLKNCKNISSQFLQTLTTHCPNVMVLDICAITAASHQNNQSPFAAPVFRPYLEKCGNNLVSLNMSENTMPSFHSCISSIMDFCPNLELLDISNVESLSKTTSISVEKLQTSCPHLRILRAANITFNVSTSGSQTDGFKSLEELSIPFKSDFSTAIIQNAHTDNVLEQLTKNAEKIKLLDIRGARYLSHRALVKIPAWNIQHLSISNCPKLNTDQLEMAFTKWSKSLIDVDISWNTSEESMTSCMKSLCEVGEDESPLRTLQLRGSAVSYESIKCLLKSCPKLESIDLQSCRGLPRGIKRSYTGQEFVTLKSEVLEGKYD